MQDANIWVGVGTPLFGLDLDPQVENQDTSGKQSICKGGTFVGEVTRVICAMCFARTVPSPELIFLESFAPSLPEVARSLDHRLPKPHPLELRRPRHNTQPQLALWLHYIGPPVKRLK